MNTQPDPKPEKQRKYPLFYEKIIPLAIVLIVIAIAIMLIMIFSVIINNVSAG